MYLQLQRRPIKLRSSKPSIKLASFLVSLGVTPNQISILSVVFALIGSICFLHAAHASAYAAALDMAGAAVCIQLRLLCNMLDGLMAVEGGKASPHGDLFNEFPDRISDVVLLVAAGCAAQGSIGFALGWAAAVLAVTTAYIRAFAARYSDAQDYCGPMAKPHRMFFLTLGSLLVGLQLILLGSRSIMSVDLIVICVGTMITCVRRTAHLSRIMENKTC